MARSEKNVYGVFILRCKQKYEKIAKEETKKNPPLMTKNGYEYVPTSANPYWTRLRALRDFYKKYAPLCAWLKYPQVNGETVINHRTYITDFSFISDILADLYSSDSSPDQLNNDVMSLLFCIMFTNLKNGILLPKTEKNTKNVFRRMAYHILKPPFNHPSRFIVGFNDVVDYYMENMNLSIIPTDLYKGTIHNFQQIKEAHEIILKCLPASKDVSEISLDYLYAALLNTDKKLSDTPNITLEELEKSLKLLGINDNLIAGIINYIRIKQKTLKDQETAREETAQKRKDLREIKNKNAILYEQHSSEQLKALKEKSDRQAALIRYFMNFHKSKDVLSVSEIICYCKEAYSLEIHDHWEPGEPKSPEGETVLDVFLYNCYTRYKTSCITGIIDELNKLECCKDIADEINDEQTLQHIMGIILEHFNELLDDIKAPTSYMSKDKADLDLVAFRFLIKFIAITQARLDQDIQEKTQGNIPILTPAS